MINYHMSDSRVECRVINTSERFLAALIDFNNHSWWNCVILYHPNKFLSVCDILYASHTIDITYFNSWERRTVNERRGVNEKWRANMKNFLNMSNAVIASLTKIISTQSVLQQQHTANVFYFFTITLMANISSGKQFVCVCVCCLFVNNFIIKAKSSNSLNYTHIHTHCTACARFSSTNQRATERNKKNNV